MGERNIVLTITLLQRVLLAGLSLVLLVGLTACDASLLKVRSTARLYFKCQLRKLMHPEFFRASQMKKPLLLLLFLLLVSPAFSAPTSGSRVTKIEECQNVSFNMEQSITGTIESIHFHRGRVLSPYGSYFGSVNSNDVSLTERTAALEGTYRSDGLVNLSYEVNHPADRGKVKPAESDRDTTDSTERRPTKISASRNIEYSGKDINDREFDGDNSDFVGANLLYNKEFSKFLSMIWGEHKARFRFRAHTTGIMDLRYLQSEPEYNKGPIKNFEVLNIGDERYYGDYNITQNISLRSRFDHQKKDDDNDWLPCEDLACFDSVHTANSTANATLVPLRKHDNEYDTITDHNKTRGEGSVKIISDPQHRDGHRILQGPSGHRPGHDTPSARSSHKHQG